jgi:hypothetical protein
MVRLRKGATFLFVLYGLDAPRPWMDLEHAIAEVRGWGYTTVPCQRMPIGRDSFDDHFWLETSGPLTGEVYFVPRADCPDCPPRRWITFEDFLCSLEPIPLD